jgi:hypothetical protein
MALDSYKNLALAQIATPPAPPASGTALTLAAGQGKYLPAPPFNGTVFGGASFPTPTTAEIIRVTALAGDVATIVRQQENTAARAILAGDYLAATFTTKFITDLTDSSNQAAGLLPDARLAANIPRLGASNLFVGPVQELGQTIRLRQPGGPVDHRLWQLVSAADGKLYVQAVNDAATIQEVAYPAVFSRGGTLSLYGDLIEKNRPTPMGHWMPIPYAASNFTAAPSGSWTVDSSDVVTLQYALVGKTLWLAYELAVTDVAGSPSELRVTLPPGYTGGAKVTNPLVYRDATAWNAGVCVLAIGASYVSLQRDPEASTNWKHTTNGTSISGTAMLPVL